VTVQDSCTLQIVNVLDACEVPYFLSGSFASNFYGIPRSTKDADFVIQSSRGVGSDFAKKLGSDLQLDSQLTFETVTGTYKQLVQHTKKNFRVEIFLLSQDPHDQQRFARRRLENLFGRKVWLLSAEDSIISKLRWSRGKDKDDIRNVISIQANKLDWPYIEKWCKEHGTLALLQEIRRSVPDI
jgi:hypothetical protein